MPSGKKDQIKGEAKDMKGRVERQAGEWAEDRKTQMRGIADQASGKAQKAVGKAKEKLERARKSQADTDAAA